MANHEDTRQRLVTTLDRGERILWMGESSRHAYVASHVAPIAFSLVFSYMACGRIVGTLLQGGMPTIGVVQALFALIGAGILIASLLSLVRDLDVSWAMTDRRVLRLSGRRTVDTRITEAVSLEIERTSAGRGTLIIRMPERKDVEGDRIYPSVRLADVADVDQAYTAAREAMSVYELRREQIKTR